VLTRELGVLPVLSFEGGPLSLMTRPTKISKAIATMTAAHSQSVGQCMNDRAEEAID